MEPHALHARATHKGVVLAGICTAAIALAVASIVIASCGVSAPASVAKNALGPGFATALRAGSDAVVQASALAIPHEPHDEQPEALHAIRASYAPTLADIATLPKQADPFAFCLDSSSATDAPILAEKSVARLEQARAAFVERNWDVGYLLIDLEAGCGLASNLDVEAYSASTYKAPYALYLCETRLDA